MNIEEENPQSVRIKKVRKSTRPKKSAKTDIALSTSTDLTDRISIKKKNQTRVRPSVQPILREEVYCTHPTPSYVPGHKKKVNTFIRTVCIAGVLAFILSDYYLVTKALRQAKIQINELTQIINTSATTRISSELDPKQSMLQDIGKRIDLPTGEEPTVVLIEDAEKASREQAFYAQVIKGDVVVIYPNAKKAIIWSPSRMKIVNAGVVDIQDNQAEDTETASTTKKNQAR